MVNKGKHGPTGWKNVNMAKKVIMFMSVIICNEKRHDNPQNTMPNESMISMAS